jgi:4-aminobutyrate aminotransferase-like enzyme
MSSKAQEYMQKYQDYVMAGFVKAVAPIVIERASGAVVTDVDGREYLDCFAGNLPARAAETGNYAVSQLRDIQKNNGMIGDVRGAGLMIGGELIKDGHKTPATAEAEALRDTCLKNGLIVGVGGIYGNVIRVQPPLVISKQQVDKAIGIFADALAAIGQPAQAGARA